MKAYHALEQRFETLIHIDRLIALAHWDEATMMPAGAGAARAAQISTLCAIRHEMLVSAETRDLLASAALETQLDAWQQRNLLLMDRDYQNATCLPVDLVKALSEQSTLCEQAWRKARGDNDWKTFEPQLTTLFNLVKTSAEIRAERFHQQPYDVLLDQFSPGVTQAFIDPIFKQLTSILPELTNQIIDKQKSWEIIPFNCTFPIAQQRELGLIVMRHLGFDFNHGRLDTSHHPFCSGFNEDVRMTTRYDEKDFLSSLLAVCHETGHACYEQGISPTWSRQPVGQPLGMSLHESQSLIIEMPACRSFEFMEFISKEATKIFGKNPAFAPENLYHLATRVEKSFIRVDADEATYPLHVILRYELERDLFAGKITIKDLPDCWHEKMQQYLGLSTQGIDHQGVLQDVHWPSGAFGYFPAYTIGRLIAAQLFNKAVTAHPNIPRDLSEGRFTLLKDWLNKHIHAEGSRYPMNELIPLATGEALNPNYFIEYLRTRYLI